MALCKPSSWSCAPRGPQTYKQKNCAPFVPTLLLVVEEEAHHSISNILSSGAAPWAFPQVPVILHIRALGRLAKAAQASKA